MTAVVAAARPDGRALGARAGAVVALPIAVVVAAIPILVAVSGDRHAVPAVLWAVALALAGLVAAACVGALWGPRLVRDPVTFRSGSILAMSTSAVVIGAYAFGILTAAALVIWTWPDLRSVAWAPLAGTIGLVALGLPALAIVVPHALAWRWLMRRWARG